MRKYFIFLILTTSIFVGFLNVSAQTGGISSEDQARIEELRKQIEELEKEAQKYRSNIAGEQAKAKSLSSEIKILENHIKKIQTQININNTKITKTEIDIGNTENNIFDKENEITKKKESISELMITIQRQDKESLLSVLLKNANLSDFLSQAHYTLNLDNSLVALIYDLKDIKSALENQKHDLEGKKGELVSLNQKNRYEQLSLGEAKSGKDSLLKVTKGQEAQYQKTLKDIEQRKSLFFTELRELETRVIQGGLYIVHITATPPPKGTNLFQWPEDDYRITQGYGYTSYSRRGAYGGAPHNGIDLAGGFGSPIKAIGDGEIVANGHNNGWGNWVAIKHNYDLVSVYGHMSALSFLRVGTKVKMGEVIGFEGSTGNSTGSHLHLSIYKEFFTYVNEKNGQLYFNYFDGSVNPNDYL